MKSDNHAHVDLQTVFKDSIDTEKQLADKFATFFQNKVETLKKPSNASEIFDKLANVMGDVPRWDLTPCTTEDVAKAIDDLKPSLSSGPDSIPNRLIKSLKFEALEALTYVFNKCIMDGVFPKVWKSGKVLPTFKKGAKNRIENYRPICLYSNLGKLLEAVIGKQMTSHMEKVLPNNMYGFRPSRSTQDAVGHALDKVHRYRAQGKKVGIISMDASSAFDLLEHEIILRSLDIIGAGPVAKEWCRSFLSDCSNFVQIGDSRSDVWLIKYGSGQGRRLSPNMFNLASISQALFCLISDFIGYADDGLDIVYGETEDECNSKLQYVVNERLAWYSEIGLSLNMSKTEIVGIGYTPAPINLESIVILPKSEITFLGTTIQSDLKWSNQISSLCNKIRSAAGRIRHEGRNLTILERRSLYMGWIQSQIHYNARVILPIISATELSAIQTASNAGIRAVVGLPKYGYADIATIRSTLGIQTVETIIEYTLQGAAWKKFSSTEPSPKVGPQTRSATNKNRPHPDQRGHLAKTSEALLTKAWNRMPLNIKTAPSLKNVKAQLKSLLYQ